VASGGSEFLLRQKFSRDTEREADDVGWNYLLAANIDPRGMTSFFAKMQKEMEKNPAAAAADGQLNLMSTHPATPERIARLEAKWKALGGAKTFAPISSRENSP
jgi:predicted Zn-dependent protease